jgi:hypothetical protein
MPKNRFTCAVPYDYNVIRAVEEKASHTFPVKKPTLGTMKNEKGTTQRRHKHEI